MTQNDDASNKPRLCHVTKWPDFNGYGFNLHAEKGKAGQYIGKVDSGSPAEAAGLKEADRIVEVNGVNIGNENHQQVVSRIKAGGEETRLLVVDSETDQYFKNSKRVVKGDLPEVLHLTSLRTEPEAEQQQDEEAPPQYNSTVETVTSSHVEEVQASVITASSSDSEYQPRLCHMKKRPDFSGYGFNLHAEKDKPGQYIGKIDDDSPAQTADLREGDRIVEVNGVNIESETHGRVIELVKSGGDETRLLVVDKAVDEYYKRQDITVSSSMSVVAHKSSVQEDVQEVTSVVENPPVFHIPPPPAELPPPDYEDDYNVDEQTNDAINYENTEEMVEATQTPELEAEVALPESTPAPEEDVQADENIEQISSEQISADVAAVVESAAVTNETTEEEVIQAQNDVVENIDAAIENTENEVETQVEATQDEVVQVSQTTESTVTEVTETITQEAAENVEAVEETVNQEVVQSVEAVDETVNQEVAENVVEDVATTVVADVPENVEVQDQQVQEDVQVTTETIEEAATVVNGQTTTVTETVTTTYSTPEPEPVKTQEAPKQPNGSGDPFGLSAKEMAAMLKSKKKRDPRSQPMGFGQKHDLFEKL